MPCSSDGSASKKKEQATDAAMVRACWSKAALDRAVCLLLLVQGRSPREEERSEVGEG
jgi:hypothetical protein